MRIAVFHNLPSGGAKRSLYNFVKYLKSIGNQIDVHIPSTANENYLPLKDIVDGFHVYPVRRTAPGLIKSSVRYVLPPYQSLADLEWTQKRIAEAINAGPYDVVFSEQDQFTMTPFVLQHLKKPTVYYCQQPFRGGEVVFQGASQSVLHIEPLPAWKRAWRAHLRRNILRIDRKNASQAKYILANSYFSREAILTAYGLNSYVSYMGIDTELFRPLTLQKENFVLSVGACHPHKGYDFALRSLSLIDEQRRPKMVIVSNSTDPHWEDHLVRMAAGLHVDLEIKKADPGSEIVGLYNRARLFVYAAILEPFGLAPVEAMACGTPVVGVREGGVRESVVHRETGILTDRDEPAFAAAVTELLQNDGLRRQMGDRGTQVVRNLWTLEQAGERLALHLERAAGAGQSAARMTVAPTAT
jgi:glycosyltransferase involved in cell wall biosynthesis